MSYMGLDIGTTGAKAVVFSADWQVLGSGYREYPLLQPQPGWAELDPARVWHLTEEAIAEALHAAGSVDPVRAIAASVQGEAVIPVDERGRPLGNAIVTFDSRTVPQAAQLEQAVGRDKVYRLSGQPLHPMGTINKIAWWKQERPDVYAHTSCFLCFADFALAQLGVEPVMDRSMAARTMAYDLGADRWALEVLTVFGIDEAMLPRVAPAGTAVGTVPHAVAQRLGLPAGVVAAVGAHDQPCGALGAGAVEPGSAMYAIGTVECVTPALVGFAPGLGQCGFPCYPHAAPGRFVTLGYNFGGGSVLRWYRDQFGQDAVAEAERTGRSVYDLLLKDMDQSVGSLLLLPHFAGTGTPWLDVQAKGALVGLTLGTTRTDVLKAVLEGTTYEIGVNIADMVATGVSVRELRAIGGGSRSDLWLQMKANILGLPIVRLEVSEAAALGAAMLGAAAAEPGLDLASVAREQAHPVRTFEPDSALHEAHAQRLEIYRQLYPALKDISHAL